MLKQDEVQQQCSRVSPYEVDNDYAEDLKVGQSFIRVMDYDGADGYTIYERTEIVENVASMAYRTVQRIDLASRLELVADFDPADIVGRAFVVGG